MERASRIGKLGFAKSGLSACIAFAVMFLLATALLNLCTTNAEAAIARVQTVSVDTGIAPSTGTVNFAATGANNLLVVAIAGGDSASLNGISVVANPGNIALTKAREQVNGQIGIVSIWYLPGASNPGGLTSITYTVTPSPFFDTASGMVFAEYSGVATTSPLDGAGADATANTLPMLSGNATSAAANELWFAAYHNATGSTAFSGYTGPAGATISEIGQTYLSSAERMGATESLVNSAGTAYINVGNAIADWWVGAIVLFKAAGTSDTTPPSSSITSPTTGTVFNLASASPTTISGTATDNVAVSSISVSTDGGTTWNAATCTGCPGASVTWSYSWTLPTVQSTSYNIIRRATDSSSNVETPGAGINVTVDRVAPTVSTTTPANAATNIAVNGNVTITWAENVNCTTVNTTNITISGGGLALSSCSGATATFTTSGQAASTTYTVTVGTGVTDVAGNHMAASYPFSYTTAAAGCTTNAPTFSAWSPTSGNVTPGGGTSYTITVTNADTVGCANANITFTAADTPATPNANFNGSTVSSNCTNIAPGGTCTATLTTSSPAGATPPSSETTIITGTESVGSKAGTTATSAATNLVAAAAPSVPVGSIPVEVTVGVLMAAYGVWMGIRQRRRRNTQQGTE